MRRGRLWGAGVAVLILLLASVVPVTAAPARHSRAMAQPRDASFFWNQWFTSPTEQVKYLLQKQGGTYMSVSFADYNLAGNVYAAKLLGRQHQVQLTENADGNGNPYPLGTPSATVSITGTWGELIFYSVNGMPSGVPDVILVSLLTDGSYINIFPLTAAARRHPLIVVRHVQRPKGRSFRHG